MSFAETLIPLGIFPIAYLLDLYLLAPLTFNYYRSHHFLWYFNLFCPLKSRSFLLRSFFNNCDRGLDS